MAAKILFVDDEPKILESIQNQLFEKIDEWQMDFVNSGEEALELAEKTNYDVVISDMRMPGMDGETLLRKVSELYPGTMRIVLSGHAVQEAAIAAIPFAHQYLAKPCTEKVLLETIGNALTIAASSSDPDVRFGISKVMDLPTHLGVYTELVVIMEDEHTDFEDIAAVIEKDVSLTLKVMFIANSALFATANPADSTTEAVQRIGGNALKMLVLAVEISGLIEEGDDEESIARQEQTQRMTQVVGELLSDHPRYQMAGAIAAILHDLGEMVFANFVSERYQRDVLDKSANKAERVDLEKQEFGICYAELGSLLLNLWRLPEEVVHAVANQNCTDPECFIDRPVSTSLMLADFLLETDEVGENIEEVLRLVSESEMGGWRERVDTVASVT